MHNAYDTRGVVPSFSVIGAFANTKFNEPLKPVAIGLGGEAIYIGKGSLRDASIYLVPYSPNPSFNDSTFSVNASEIMAGIQPNDNGYPIEHFRARELLMHSQISNSFSQNLDWEAAVDSWREEARSLKMLTFFMPEQRPALIGLSSILLYGRTKRKVICFIPINARPSELERQFASCLAVLYGYLGPELDYSIETSTADFGAISTLKDCGKTIGTKNR